MCASCTHSGVYHCHLSLPPCFVLVCHPHRDLGGKLRFSGQVSTVKCFENNPLVRKVCSGGTDTQLLACRALTPAQLLNHTPRQLPQQMYDKGVVNDLAPENNTPLYRVKCVVEPHQC